jgi:hypothetical protein
MGGRLRRKARANEPLAAIIKIVCPVAESPITHSFVGRAGLDLTVLRLIGKKVVVEEAP